MNKAKEYLIKNYQLSLKSNHFSPKLVAEIMTTFAQQEVDEIGMGNKNGTGYYQKKMTIKYCYDAGMSGVCETQCEACRMRVLKRQKHTQMLMSDNIKYDEYSE